MSIRAMPMLVLSLILYNIVAFFFGDPSAPHAIFREELFAISMPLGGLWSFSWGDLILAFSLVMLGIEVVKSTYTRGSGLADQALSIVLLVAFLVEFLLVREANTSVFFLIFMMSMIDVIAGAIIGIRTARRDFGGDFGG
ncbi:MAG: hypothetical protein AAFQ42_09570 [Pseudomonadota bacterium]